MKVQNSYIFLVNPYKKEKKKLSTAAGNKIIYEIGKNIHSYILDSFPDISCEKENTDFFKKVYSTSIPVGLDTYNVKFIINEVVDATYLDVIVDGKNKSQIIKCVEQVQERLLSSGIRDKYIDIISYDSISEYYCNKILPKLNALERNLRKLLFNIYIVNFGKDYYHVTISPELQNKIKGVIKAKGNDEKKEIERLQQFFYSFELNDIQKLLFVPSWTHIDEQAKNKFLRENTDLSHLSDEQLRDAISQFTPKSDWERFFSNKIDIPDIEGMIEKIRQHRNSIAHFKFFNRTDYIECRNLIYSLNHSVLKAIEITESKDFVEKNLENFRTAMSEIRIKMEKSLKELTDTVKKSMTEPLNIFHSSIFQVVEQNAKSSWLFDPSKFKKAVSKIQDDSPESGDISQNTFSADYEKSDGKEDQASDNSCEDKNK